MLAALLVLPLQGLLAESVSDLPKPNDYVNDYARVLSIRADDQLDRLCAELDHSVTNTQIAIVTVHNLDGEDAADWANQLEDKWHMGKKGSDKGVLVLLAVDDHKWRIDIGYGLEGILNDARVGDIGRSMVPYLRAKDYDDAVLSAVGQIAQIVAADAKITLDDSPVTAPVPQRPPSPPLFIAVAKLLPFLILLFLFGGFGLLRFLFAMGLINSALGGRRYSGGSGPFIGGGGWGGGGGGGGDSGGGGFGGFGGGGFGGGGAGGSW
jgi:uncharacterized protein